MNHHARIMEAIRQHDGWSYTKGNPNFPSIVAGMPAGVAKFCQPLHSPGSTNCSSFTSYCIFFGYSSPEAQLRASLWGELSIWEEKRPWSPIEGVISEGIGVPSTLEYPGLYLTQTWSLLDDAGHADRASRGHARIVEVLTGLTLRVYEASMSAGRVRTIDYPHGAHTTWGDETRVAALIP